MGLPVTFTMTKEQIEAMRATRVRWTVDAEGNIFDADFTFDAMLTLNGDFASNIIKQDYAQMIADALNASELLSK